MSISVTPIPRLIDLAAPSFTLGTANAAGSAVTAVASDATLLAFDTTDPAAVAAAAVVGSATVSARRDHVHAGATYEVGTFTPAINFGGASAGVTYSSRLGAYTKIGDRCYFTLRLVLTSKGSSTGAVNVTGLPFTVYNNAANYAACPVQFSAVSFADMVMVQLNINDTIVVIWQLTNAGVLTQLDNTNYADNSTMHITGQYKTA